MNYNEFNISNNRQRNVKIVGGKNLVKLTDVPNEPFYNTVLLCLIAADGTEIDQQKIERNNGALTYPLPHIPVGRYTLRVMRKTDLNSSWFYDWISKVQIAVGRDRMVSFVKSPVYDDNANFFGKMKADRRTIEQYKIMPRGDNADIIRKAYQITQGCFTDYSKALAIHDWIADNIYYDYDSYNSNHIDYSKLGTAAAVFRNKLAVCCGYSDLAVIMLRAVGIPAYSASCYALGVSTAGAWNHNNINSSSNHAITLAYIQKRWIIMDITWDSGNKYENGRFQHTNDTIHRYFDPTLQSFSNTHKFCA
jgi:transglutaminase-like putative cysteine protease